MFIEMLDTLRCVADHPQIPLVTAISSREGRFVSEGIVGCPTCRREYPISKGVVWFRAIDESLSLPPAAPPDDEGAIRLAAFLAVTGASTIALVGHATLYAEQVSEMIESRVFAVNPATAMRESDSVGVVCTERRTPFADASLSGIAIGEAGWSASDFERAVRTLAAGGRMVGDASLDVPRGMIEIARDEKVWVAEKQRDLVALHRR